MRELAGGCRGMGQLERGGVGAAFENLLFSATRIDFLTFLTPLDAGLEGSGPLQARIYESVLV